jgi:hypothetical protein
MAVAQTGSTHPKNLCGPAQSVMLAHCLLDNERTGRADLFFRMTGASQVPSMCGSQG